MRGDADEWHGATPSRLNPEQLPGPRHAFELVFASVVEFDTRTRHEILDPWPTPGSPPATPVHPLVPRTCTARFSEIIASNFTFARVQPHPEIDTQLARGLTDGLSAPDGASGAVERGHEPVTGGIDLPPTESAELFSHGSIVSVQERAPALVAQRCGVCGGTDDVGDQDGGEDPIDLDVRSIAGQSMTRAFVSSSGGPRSPPGISMKVAPLMCSARYRPYSIDKSGLSLTWRIRVGAYTSGSATDVDVSEKVVVLGGDGPRCCRGAVHHRPPVIPLSVVGATWNRETHEIPQSPRRRQDVKRRHRQPRAKLQSGNRRLPGIAAVLRRTRALTRSGCMAANRMAIGPVSSVAMMAVLVDPAASRTAVMSSVTSLPGGHGIESNRIGDAGPRRSKTMSLVNEANCVRRRARDSSTRRGRCGLPGHNTKGDRGDRRP